MISIMEAYHLRPSNTTLAASLRLAGGRFSKEPPKKRGLGFRV